MSIDITVLFNNIAGDSRLQTAHGLACFVEGCGKTILFDTGCDAHILLENMDILGKKPEDADIVVISHMHWDHNGGLWDALRRTGPVDLYLPKSASKEYGKHAEMLGARVTRVDGPEEIVPGVRSTGEMGGKIKEQSLVFDIDGGAAVLTGGAHPGIVDIVGRGREVAGATVRFALGGFHLRSWNKKNLGTAIAGLRRAGVERDAASHCTGDMPTDMFRAEWGGDFVGFACGDTVRLETAGP